MPGSRSFSELGKEILSARWVLTVRQALTVNREGVMTWLLWMAMAAMAEMVEAATAVEEMAVAEIEEPRF
ncbi:MAG TPA: hypothetical protein VNP98_16895 [Chthoniobacterales bacterium]|nr:hypothetical protein [Chthoniobacterales bacterium]